MVKIVGNYKFESSENSYEFAKALGLSSEMCKIANAAVSSVDITLDGDTYTLKTVFSFKTTEIKFKLGEEFEHTTVDGRVVKSTIVLKGNKLIQNQVGDKNLLITKVFTDTGMVNESKVGDVVVKVIFKRQD